MTAATGGRRRGGWRAAGIGAGALLAVVGALLVATWQWTAALQAEERLLPGTVVADVTVGEQGVGDAAAAVWPRLAGRLDRPLAVAAVGTERAVTPRALGATQPTRAALEAALASAAAPTWTEAVRAVLLRSERAIVRDVPVTVADEQARAYVAEVADDVDRAAADATMAWSAAGLEVVADRVGRQLDRAAAAEELQAAVRAGRDRVSLPVATEDPAVRTAAVEAVLATAQAAVDARLDRVITLHHADATWEVTPRDLGARPDTDAVLRRVLAATGGLDDANEATAAAHDETTAVGGTATPQVPVVADSGAVAGTIAAIAEELDRPGRDAELDYSTGRIEVVAEQVGRRVDRVAATVALAAAVDEQTDTVDLPVEVLEPETTTEDFHQVLLVRQDERRLYLYTDGEVTREWAVAIGTGSSPTPTGTFTLGAKRHLPTWYNPAPDGWGADMPAVVGPGPGNPLGVRALNWNRDGRDTLIRFHGTANVGSIGRAASQGCVRLTNPDVVDLYDLVDTGTPIVSLWG